jgi:hypothetical protein
MTPQKGRALPGEAGWALNTGHKAAGRHKTCIHVTTSSSSVKQNLKRFIVFLALRGLIPLTWADWLIAWGGLRHD